MNVPTASCDMHTGMQSSKQETTDCDLRISVQECWCGEMCVLYVLQLTLLKRILTSFIWALHFSDAAANVLLPT